MGKFGILFLMILLVAMLIALPACDDDDDDDSTDAEPDDDDDDDAADDDDDDTADDDDDDDVADDDDDYNEFDKYPALLPGPGQEGYNEDLEELARMYDRNFHVFIASGTGLNMDLSVSLADTEDREDIENFIRQTEGWDFEVYSGKAPMDVIDTYHKVAGLYAGAGISADAFRYGVLRDQGYPAEEVDRARQHLIDGLDSMHIAQAITGVPGVIARGLHRKDIPGYGATVELVPLFDQYGNPLPEVKNNGTWRADNSPNGDYPNWVWEDSCSRDMFIGWASAMATTWEVIRDDPTFSEEIKDRLQNNAKELLVSLRTVQESGFDLEIMDADGRTTFHGYINENAFDRIYLPWLPIKDSVYAIMALGIVGSLTYVAEDPDLDAYLHQELIGERRLHEWVKYHMIGLDLWIQSNYSAYNMVFHTAYLASRYIASPAVHQAIAASMYTHMYNHENFHSRQPRYLKQSLFDFVFAACTSYSNAWSPMYLEPDREAIDNGVETLLGFPDPPDWAYEVINCDQDEIDSGFCTLLNGQEVRVLGYIGRNDSLITDTPIPMEVRFRSNYHWRSNPFGPNGGGDGSGMNPGVDFRWAYWLGRWTN